MSNKRKSSEVPNEEAELKRPRRRRRSQSEPRDTASDSSQKREALRRLFSRVCSNGQDMDNEAEAENEDEAEEPVYIEDPLLLDSIPECMDPEQLGFLLCAQETLRFLRQNGMPYHHAVYVNLRNRFVKALEDIGVA